MVFSLNTVEAQPIVGSGTVSFDRRMNTGDSFDVRIQQLPPALVCTLSGERGTIASSNIIINVACNAPQQSVALIKDINAQSTENSSSPADFTVFDSRVVFTASLEPQRRRLFVADGTSSGARPLFDQDVRFPFVVGSLGNRLLFQETVGLANLSYSQLSVFDESTGTRGALADVTPGFGYRIGNRMLFFAFDKEERFGNEPWISDGTRSGTRLIKDIRPGLNSAAADPGVLVSGDRWFFVAFDGNQSQVWSSDGTDSGTLPVTSPSRRVIKTLGVHNGRIYFYASDTNGSNASVWSTDGAANSEVLVQALTPDGTGSIECFFSASNGFYYVANAVEQSQFRKFLWFSTGGPVGPTKLIGVGSSGVGSGGLVQIEGDACGFTELAGKVYFGAGGSGFETNLWVSDGTAVGTRRVASDLFAFNIASQFILLGLPDRVIFARNTPDLGRELWWTDGVRVELVSDIEPGPASGLPERSNLIGRVFNGKAYFAAQTVATGIEPWITDGTSAGTAALGNLAAELRTLDGVDSILGYTSAGVFFSGCKVVDDCELWVSNGTSGGTKEVVDLDPSRGSNPRRGFAYRDRLYFTNNLGGLWVSDGTTLGTRKLSAVSALEFHDTGSVLLFASNGGDDAGQELWRTDGTEAGTHLLVDIAPGRSDSRPTQFVSAGNWVYYKAAVSSNFKAGLWRTDPVTAATEFLSGLDIVSNSPATPFVTVNGQVIFPANDGTTGFELWRSNGTTTARVADINPGLAGSNPGGLTVFGNEVFFRGRDADHYGLWASDGSAVREIAAVTTDDYDDPGNLAVINGKLFLSASAHPDGHRLSVLDSPNATLRYIADQDGSPLVGPRTFRRLNAEWSYFTAQRDSASRPFVTDGQRVVYISDKVQVRDEDYALAVPTGEHAGVWFVGFTDAEGRELWRLK